MGGLWRVCLVALCASCVEAHLTPCGDNLCPTGDTCVQDRCVTPAQLVACTGGADLSPCSFGDAVGLCFGGACIAVGCGNGTIDPGEVCDDGNTAYADGCSGDCRSLETCGNGIVDFALGESCDCGIDAASRPARCASPNSDDPEAECTPQCQLRYCGDGKLDHLEQCDDTDLGGATCGDFGYYEGQPSCSGLCRFDVAGCAKRCGDGVVDAGYGEFCDGSAPQGSCITYGFDGGTIGCAAACSPSVTRCEQFGWQQIDGASILSLWPSTSFVLVVDAAGAAYVVINNVRVPAPAGVYAVAIGDELHGFALGATAVGAWSGGSWSAIAPPWPSTITPTAAWVSDVGLYVVAGGALWRLVGSTWTDQGLAGLTGVGGNHTTIYAWSDTALWSSSGGAWTAETPPTTPIKAVTATSDGRVWLSSTNLWLRDGTWAEYNGQAGLLGIQVDDAGKVCGMVGAATAACIVLLPNGAPLRSTISSPIVPKLVRLTHDGGVLAAGTSGTLRLRTQAWSAIDVDLANDFALIDQAMVRINVAPIGFVMLTGAEAAWLYVALPSMPYTIGANASAAWEGGVFSGVPYFATGSGVVDEIGDIAADGSYRTMSVAPDGELVAGGIDVVARSQPSWHTIDATGYDVTAITRGAGSTIYAIATCGANHCVISINDGVAPNELMSTTQPLTDLWADRMGNLVAVGGDRVWTYTLATWSFVTIPNAAFLTVAGTSLSDLFAGGMRHAFDDGTELMHWDGAMWTPIKLLDNSTGVMDMQISGSTLYYVDGGPNLYRLGRVANW